ncbi:MAG: hypothetical protein EBT92_19280 [Planctomycetes bacterium]|nr:hypothetical protein [Planctomycetota bacterium]
MAQVDLAYDSVGRLGSLTRTANGDPSTTISTNYALDLLDRVTSITHRFSQFCPRCQWPVGERDRRAR